MKQQIGILRIADIVGDRILCQGNIDSMQCLLQFGVGNFIANRLRYFFYQNFHSIVVANLVPGNDIPQQDFLINAGNILALCFV